MKLVLQQNQVGKFYLGSDDETLSFRLAFRDDDNEIIRVGKDGLPLQEGSEEKGELAIFQMPSNPGNPDNASQWYRDLFDDSDYQGLFDEHLNGHSGFTTGLDYPEQRIMFAYFIEKYFVEIYNNALGELNAKGLKRIETLEKELKMLKARTYVPAYVEDTPNLFNGIVAQLEKEIETYISYRDVYIEGNKNWTEWDERLTKSKAKLNRIKAIRTEVHNG